MQSDGLRLLASAGEAAPLPVVTNAVVPFVASASQPNESGLALVQFHHHIGRDSLRGVLEEKYNATLLHKIACQTENFYQQVATGCYLFQAVALLRIWQLDNNGEDPTSEMYRSGVRDMLKSCLFGVKNSDDIAWRTNFAIELYRILLDYQFSQEDIFQLQHALMSAKLTTIQSVARKMECRMNLALFCRFLEAGRGHSKNVIDEALKCRKGAGKICQVLPQSEQTSILEDFKKSLAAATRKAKKQKVGSNAQEESVVSSGRFLPWQPDGSAATTLNDSESCVSSAVTDTPPNGRGVFATCLSALSPSAQPSLEQLFEFPSPTQRRTPNPRSKSNKSMSCISSAPSRPQRVNRKRKRVIDLDDDSKLEQMDEDPSTAGLSCSPSELGVEDTSEEANGDESKEGKLEKEGSKPRKRKRIIDSDDDSELREVDENPSAAGPPSEQGVEDTTEETPEDDKSEEQESDEEKSKEADGHNSDKVEGNKSAADASIRVQVLKDVSSEASIDIVSSTIAQSPEPKAVSRSGSLASRTHLSSQCGRVSSPLHQRASSSNSTSGTKSNYNNTESSNEPYHFHKDQAPKLVEAVRKFDNVETKDPEVKAFLADDKLVCAVITLMQHWPNLLPELNPLKTKSKLRNVCRQIRDIGLRNGVGTCALNPDLCSSDRASIAYNSLLTNGAFMTCLRNLVHVSPGWPILHVNPELVHTWASKPDSSAAIDRFWIDYSKRLEDIKFVAFHNSNEHFCSMVLNIDVWKANRSTKSPSEATFELPWIHFDTHVSSCKFLESRGVLQRRLVASLNKFFKTSWSEEAAIQDVHLADHQLKQSDAWSCGYRLLVLWKMLLENHSTCNLTPASVSTSLGQQKLPRQEFVDHIMKMHGPADSDQTFQSEAILLHPARCDGRQLDTAEIIQPPNPSFTDPGSESAGSASSGATLSVLSSAASANHGQGPPPTAPPPHVTRSECNSALAKPVSQPSTSISSQHGDDDDDDLSDDEYDDLSKSFPLKLDSPSVQLISAMLAQSSQVHSGNSMSQCVAR